MSDDSIGDPFDNRTANRRLPKLKGMRAARPKKKTSEPIQMGGVHRRRNKRWRW